MSMRTLPLVFINLGGEMLYILDQRLHAHSTSEDKSEKVMNDIVGTMFSQAFMDEILKPQLLYSHRTMKVVLTRLAHVSIMKLNAVSMEKVTEHQDLIQSIQKIFETHLLPAGIVENLRQRGQNKFILIKTHPD
uniref:Protein OSCP1-like n=1 Tax=Hippocampus comes TaxID=109280 RepID=A0A3Q2YKR4_HIPCM